MAAIHPSVSACAGMSVERKEENEKKENEESLPSCMETAVDDDATRPLERTNGGRKEGLVYGFPSITVTHRLLSPVAAAASLLFLLWLVVWKRLMRLELDRTNEGRKRAISR